LCVVALESEKSGPYKYGFLNIFLKKNLLAHLRAMLHNNENGESLDYCWVDDEIDADFAHLT